MFRKDKEDFIEYLETTDLEDIKNSPAIIEMIKDDAKKLDRYPTIVYAMSLVYSLAHFEAFLSEITKELFLAFPLSLSNSKKQLSYEEIIKNNANEKLINIIIQRELIEISFKNIKEQIEYLSTKFNISYKYVKGESTWGTDELDIEALVELFSIRNMILHNNSIVNVKFLKDNPDSLYKEGDKLIVTDKQVSKAILLLLAVGHKFAFKAKEKIQRKE
ncbi:MAG: hypothetical protein QM737_18755 [Ferruginibacter sp.]